MHFVDDVLRPHHLLDLQAPGAAPVVGRSGAWGNIYLLVEHSSLRLYGLGSPIIASLARITYSLFLLMILQTNANSLFHQGYDL